jgi:hypothetical protein
LNPVTGVGVQVASVVDLLREGRGALHTCFGSFKFLIMYGLLFSVLKLCSYWYGVIVSQMMYIVRPSLSQFVMQKVSICLTCVIVSQTMCIVGPSLLKFKLLTSCLREQ